MNGFLLLLPFFGIRFGLLSALNRKALRRAAYFAPVQGAERNAYVLYQLANIALFLYLLRLRVQLVFSWICCLGLFCYLAGLLLCLITMVDFSAPSEMGLHTNGLYRFSRNPMYIAYFICFMGMALLTKSIVFFGILLVFQVSAHWIILSEERWCREQFGEVYEQYQEKVRRYF